MTTDTLKTVQALELADALDAECDAERITFHTGRKAAIELRRQHALIAQMQRDAVQPADVLEDQCPNCDPRRFCTRKECAAPQPAPESQQDQLQQPDGHSVAGVGTSSYDATALHAAIMNLPCDPEIEHLSDYKRELYKTGHRDARHAAAELVASTGAAGAQQQDDHAGSPAPSAWLIEWDGGRTVCLHNAVGDYRDQHPEATSTKLYTHPAPSSQSSKAALSDDDVVELRAEHGWAKETIRAIERAILARAGIGESRHE